MPYPDQKYDSNPDQEDEDDARMYRAFDRMARERDTYGGRGRGKRSKPTFMDAVSYVFHVIGLLFLLIGGALFLPVPFEYGMGLGLGYLGVYLWFLGNVLIKL